MHSRRKIDCLAQLPEVAGKPKVVEDLLRLLQSPAPPEWVVTIVQ
jgi:hypothetical protein